jgi:biopolymer transport protein ExbB
MQRLFIILLTALSALLPAAANAWWQGDWHYRKQISVDTTPQGGAISTSPGRMPLLVRLHSGNFAFDGVDEKGTDLRFVASDDKTPLNFQIESFDPLMGTALVWVDVPAVQGGQRQDIWMYYGNKKTTPASNGQLAFDPNYVAVYHFEGVAGAPARDTTAYGNNAQTGAAGSVDGVLGHAAQFSGQPVILPASQSLAVAAGGAFTFSAWVRDDQVMGDQLIYARRDGSNSLLIGLSNGTPFVEVNGQRSPANQALKPAAWQNVAVTAEGSNITLYVNGQPAATLAAALPALNSVTALGGDAPAAAPAPSADPAAAAAAPAPVQTYAPFVGAIDEVRISKIARPAALLQASASAEGAESRLVAYGNDEEASSFGFGAAGFLFSAVPADAWVIIAILAVMMVQSWVIMVRKSSNVSRVSRANEAFRRQFSQVGTRLESLADNVNVGREVQHSTLWRLYSAAVDEIRTRRSQGADTATISAATIEAIRASMDAVRTRENQQLGSRLGSLSNAIAGGPYIGLLGTVLGIMVVFLGTAMAGDVNINAIAPGMAAALMATAMGLFVAIPALFGYNRLVSRNKDVSADMRVFVDEFITRLAEIHGVGSSGHAANV